MSIRWIISDISAMVGRNLIKYRRLPQLIVFSSIQPVMFLLLFRYVFGGAINTGTQYINFLLPGIFVQTMMFGSIGTGIGLADDIKQGMIDRFRTLPMARSAVLAGRTLADMVRNVFVFSLMLGVGYLIGFRFQGSLLDFVAMFALCLAFSFAFSWIAAGVGLSVKDTETAQVAGFIWMFPLAFASAIFVPTRTMPHALRVFAEHSPVTYTVNVVRALALDQPIGDSLWYSLAWIAGILVIFVPYAISRYRNIA